jgi:hypothetical protein
MVQDASSSKKSEYLVDRHKKHCFLWRADGLRVFNVFTDLYLMNCYRLDCSKIHYDWIYSSSPCNWTPTGRNAHHSAKLPMSLDPVPNNRTSRIAIHLETMRRWLQLLVSRSPHWKSDRPSSPAEAMHSSVPLTLPAWYLFITNRSIGTRKIFLCLSIERIYIFFLNTYERIGYI